MENPHLLAQAFIEHFRETIPHPKPAALRLPCRPSASLRLALSAIFDRPFSLHLFGFATHHPAAITKSAVLDVEGERQPIMTKMHPPNNSSVP
jgi:hypothetical protein